MLNNFEDFIDREVIRRFETTVHSTPGKRRTFLAIGLELQQRVIDAVEKHLIVDVLTLSQEGLQHISLAACWRLHRGLSDHGFALRRLQYFHVTLGFLGRSQRLK